jgi:hypothetical protein
MQEHPVTWFRIDDNFYDHPKVKAIPRGNLRKGAVALWTRAGAWCARYTDGILSADSLADFDGTTREAQALVDARLWHDEHHTCPDCPPCPPGHYLFHQWLEQQPAKAAVERRRDEARERMRRLRTGGQQPPDDPAVRDLFARTPRRRAP